MSSRENYLTPNNCKQFVDFVVKRERDGLYFKKETD